MDAAARIGLRFHPTRGSMDLGQSQGGLPPDSVVESHRRRSWRASQDAVERFHDPSPGAMVRVGARPVLAVLGQRRPAHASRPTLARSLGVRLHTHLAETLDEEEYCQRPHGCTPVEYLDRLGWLGDDVWLAHAVHLTPAAIARLGATGTGVAHCPSSNARLGAGIAPSRALLDAGVPVGLGVDGAASQEAGRLVDELRQARLRRPDPCRRTGLAGPTALTARAGAGDGHDRRRPLPRPGRRDRLARGGQAGRPGAVAAGRARATPASPTRSAALVLGSAPPLELLTVGGRVVVERDELRTADEATIVTADLRARLRRRCAP